MYQPENIMFFIFKEVPKNVLDFSQCSVWVFEMHCKFDPVFNWIQYQYKIVRYNSVNVNWWNPKIHKRQQEKN